MSSKLTPLCSVRPQPTRREFLQSVGAGVAGVAAAGLTPTAVLAARNRGLQPAKHLIVVYLWGGPSHIDTFDPKPSAAVVFRNIDSVCQTTIPGVFLSENLPRLAARLDGISLIRSLHHDGPATHEAGRTCIQSGHFSATRSGVSWDESIANQFEPFSALPNYVTLGQRFSSASMSGPAVSVSQSFSGDDVGPTEFHFGGDASQRSGFPDILAHEIAGRSPFSQRDYGTHALGRDCLRARMLVEQGVRVVAIHQFGTVYDQVTWDMHAGSGRLKSNHDDYRNTLCPQLDQALSALLGDLRETGLLDETVVLAVGEMGRSPRINTYGGRDHHPGVWSALITGGPIRRGRIIGESDAIGETPFERPVTTAELGATVCHAMGASTPNSNSGEVEPQASVQPIGELF